MKVGKGQSILTSTMMVSMLAVVIKFLGLVKQSILASYCGATEETDMFFIVSGVLVSLCTMIFSAISISLLPIHAETLIQKGREEANDLINKVLRNFLPASLVITLLFIIFAPWIAKGLAPSYSGEQIAVMAQYIRMMSLVFVLWCYYLTINVVLETDKEFVPGRGQNLFQNIFLIISAIWVYSHTGISSLIWAFVLSGVAECLLVTWCARKRFRLIWGKLNTPSSEIKKLYQLAIPLVLGSAVYEVNDIVDKQISSGLGEGNVSYLTYGSTINEIVTGVIVMALSVVLFSHFATWVASQETEKLCNCLRNTIVYLTLFILPITAICIFAGREIVGILYARGNFGEEETHYTYLVAAGYALGFVFSAIRAVMVKAFYALQDTKSPMKNGIFSVVLNIALSITLSRYMGIWGVSLATSLAMLFSTIYMTYQLKPHLPSFSLDGQWKEIGKCVVATVVMNGILWSLFNINLSNAFADLMLKMTVGIVTYVLVLFILRASCIGEVRRKLNL